MPIFTTPFAQLDLIRQPDQANDPLQAFDAAEIAQEFGDIRLGNTVMLGAMSDHLPFPAAVLRDAVAARFAHKKPGLLDMNMRAFDAGRERAAALTGQGCVAA